MLKNEFQLGKDLLLHLRGHWSNYNIFDLQWYRNQILKFSSLNPKLQQELFKFVDVLPNLKTEEQIINYFCEYICNNNLLRQLISQTPILKNLSAFTISSMVSTLAKTFVAGSTIDEALYEIKKLKKQKLDYTLDVLGELVLSDKEAETFFAKYLELLNKIPNLALSIKLSSLCPQINPLDFKHKADIIKERLRTIYRHAIKNNASITVDSEHYFYKSFYFEILQEILLEDEFINWQGAGIVIQAYLTDSETDLDSWIDWARKRQTPISIRLVKGAYWDYETAIAKQKGWIPPVYQEKVLTDMNFEKLTEKLLDNHKFLKPAIASHNIRSLVHALAYAEKQKIKPKYFELQMLYGMLDHLKTYLANKGYQVRVYLPYGNLIPGMSYLVRRLLENTANNSFLKQSLMDNIALEKVLQEPKIVKPAIVQVDQGFMNLAISDFSKSLIRKQMKEAINNIATKNIIPLLIGKEEIYTENIFHSHNPASPNSILASISAADITHCDRAIELATSKLYGWQHSSIELRARVLELTAKEITKQRYFFAALLCLEAGKPWIDADYEVCEMVDFLNYYAAEARELFRISKLRSLTGERNYNLYQSYGLATIISPWNFPLAIMGGMTAAALVTGNATIIKPSCQTSLIAYEFTKLLQQSIHKLCPEMQGIVSLLHGDGQNIGNYLVNHYATNLIAFTGSSVVGNLINTSANQSLPRKQVIAEMGGKNAIIIDLSADLDEAIPGVIHAAFGYAGQKCSACSRVIIEQDIYDEFCARLAQATKELNISNPTQEACFVPPQIDLKAQQKTLEYIELGKQEGKALVADLSLPGEGYFVSPTIFTDLPNNSKLLKEEIFGPVLAVIKANNIDHAIALANDSAYGLTGAIYSRSPNNINKAINDFVVGNLYINKPSTGAIVSRQAFGGLKQSSIGFKAGGPNYLLQFVQEKTISENTMRKGFVD